MGEPQRAPAYEPEAQAHERARREAEAAVADVMVREAAKAHARDQAEARRARHRRDPRKALLLLSLCAINAYLWLGDPEWLRFDVPPAPTYEYYVKGWEMAVAMQAERIETYRASKGIAPRSPREAGQPVRGVAYERRGSSDYRLAAGEGARRVTFDSKADSTRRPLLRRLLTQTAGPSGRAR